MDGKVFQEKALSIERLLYHVSYSLLHRQQDCADVVQEALLKAWKNRKKLRDETAFTAWMVRILINTCNETIRKRRETPIEFDETIPAEHVDNLPLQEALAKLPVEMRLPVVMFYMDGCTIKEISESTDTPEGTVKSRLSRGREKLREFLTEEE